MSIIYYKLRSSQTRGPDVATGISRSIFMSCHDNARGVMFDSDLESRADLIKWNGTAYTPNVTYIQQMSHMVHIPQVDQNRPDVLFLIDTTTRLSKSQVCHCPQFWFAVSFGFTFGDYCIYVIVRLD